MFLSVVREGSFSAAARSLRVAPSTVSRRIATLEDRTGVRLFERTTRQMTLTDAGRLFHESVTPLLDELEHAAERARDAQRVVRGTIRVATPTSFAHEQVAPWLQQLQTLHPELRVELVLGSRTSDLLEERIDVALRLGPVQTSSLIALRLCEMPRVVVASPGYLESRGRPRRPRDLESHACLAFPFEGFGSRWSFRDARRKLTHVDLEPIVVVPEGLVLRSLALRGAGLTLLPRWLVAEPLHEGTLVDVFPRYDVTATVHDAAVWLVFPSRQYLPLKVRTFVDFVKNEFREGPPWERMLR